MHPHSIASESSLTGGRNRRRRRPPDNPPRRIDPEKAAYALADVARELAATLDLPRATSLVVSTVFRLFRVGRSVLYEIDEASGGLVCVAAAGKIDPREWVGRTLPPGEGIVGQAVERGRLIWVADALANVNIRRPDWLRTRLREGGYRSVVAVPLITRQRKLGAVVIADRPRRAFAKDDLRLLTAFADLAALSLENARLHDETHGRLRQTETLLAVSQAAASTLDVTESTRRVTRELTRALGGDMGGAYLADASHDFLRPISGYHVPPDLLDTFLQVPIPLRGHPFLEEAWSQQRPVLSRDAETDPRVDRATIHRFPHRSILFVPMIVRDEPIGGLFVAWRTERHRFTPEELRLAEGISRQSALTVANAQLHTALQETADLSAGLLAWSEALASVRDLDRIVETIARLTPKVLGLQRCGLFLLEPTGRALVPTRAWGLDEQLVPAFHALRDAPKIRAVVRVVKSRLPVVVGAPVLETLIPPELARSFDIRSILVIPLISDTRLVGIMALDSPGVEHLFSPRQIALAREIGGRAGAAIATARAFRERRQRPDPVTPARSDAG
jgi:GAF domain-containing protein